MHLLDPIQTRIIDICCNGLGADGAFGAEAQQRAIRAGVFRYTDVPINDVALHGSAFSRGMHIRWLSETDETINDFDPTTLMLVKFELTVGYQSGIAMQALTAKVTPTEDTEKTVMNVTMVALSEARWIRDAVCYHPLFNSTLTDPAITDIVREGASRVDPIGGGRWVASQTFRVALSKTHANEYLP